MNAGTVYDAFFSAFGTGIGLISAAFAVLGFLLVGAYLAGVASAVVHLAWKWLKWRIRR